MNKGSACSKLLLVVFYLFGICSQIHLASTFYDNPCHVSGTPAVVEINDAYFFRIVHRIIAGRGSDVDTQCRSIYDQATNLKKIIMRTYPISLLRAHLQNDLSTAFFCNLTNGLSRIQTIECMKSAYEMLWNLSISTNEIIVTDYNFAKQNIGELLHYLQEVKTSIDRALCSFASNGLAQLVNLNSTNLHVGPLDIVQNISSTARQIQVVLMIYKLTNVIENVCETSSIPYTFNQLDLQQAE